MNRRPNLFYWANKELSQDSFLCWLIEWAHPQNRIHDLKLHKAGKLFLELLFKTHNHIIKDILEIRVYKQYRNIDILVHVRTQGDNYVIIIEDKVHSTDYNNLSKYLEVIKTDDRFSKCEPFGIFVKTGDQASYKKVKDQGFSLFLRKDFVDFFQQIEPLDIENHILVDYHQNLIEYDEQVNAYKSLKIRVWCSNINSWKGFYEFLARETKFHNWKYISNKGGGFVGAFWSKNFRISWREYIVYLQIEQKDLCFKIGEVDGDKNKRKEVRSELFQLIMKEAQIKGVNTIKKPSSFGNGRFMTIAKIESKDWLGDDDSIVNKEFVKLNLLKYDEFLNNLLLL